MKVDVSEQKYSNKQHHQCNTILAAMDTRKNIYSLNKTFIIPILNYVGALPLAGLCAQVSLL